MRVCALLRRIARDPIRPGEIDPIIVDAYRHSSDQAVSARNLERLLRSVLTNREEASGGG